MNRVDERLCSIRHIASFDIKMQVTFRSIENATDKANFSLGTTLEFFVEDPS